MSRRNPGTLGVWGPNGSRVVASESKWREPLKWDREAREAGQRRRVFCASLADVFEDWLGPIVNAKGERLFVADAEPNRWIAEVPGATYLPIEQENREKGVYRLLTMDDVRERLFGLIDDTPNLDWLLLTKRPENVIPTLERLGNTSALVDCWLTETTLPRNLWLGVSAEDQEQADRRIPILLSIPAAVRFVSAEPLLGPIDFRRVPGLNRVGNGPGIDWVICGGESGPKRRPMELGWLTSIVEQCRIANVPCFVKQDSASRDGQQGHIPDDVWAIKQFPEVG